MVLDTFLRGNFRQILAVLCVSLLLVGAGCAGLGGDDETSETPEQTPTPESAYAGLFEDIGASLGEETTESLRALVTDGSGTLTPTGEQFMQRLDTVAELGTQQRDAVVRSITETGELDDETVSTLDGILASPDAVASEVLASGLTDSDGDGLLDGEATALGINSTSGDSRVVDIAQTYREDGYDDTERAVLGRLAALNDSQWTQIAQLDLRANLESTPTEETLAAIRDDSGDGLLNGVATELNLDTDSARPDLAAVVAGLGEDGFTRDARLYLEQYAVVNNNQTTRAQVSYLDLDRNIEAGIFTREARLAIQDEDGDGILNGMEEELGLDPDSEDPDVAGVVAHLAVGGYNETEQTYIERIIEFRQYRGHDYEYWAQAEQLGMLDSAIENGTVTDRQLWMLENNASNRLLNGMEVEFGTDPEKADTSGDGYEDHLLWGPMQDLGLEVRPASPNIYVEVDTASGVAPPSEEQITAIQDTFESEPPEEIGPINMQFHVCWTETPDIIDFDDFVDIDEDSIENTPDPAASQRNITGLGFQYLFLTDGLVAGGVAGFAPSKYLMDQANIQSFAVVNGRIWRNRNDIEQAATIAHELGHTMGLGGADYAGIDSRQVPIEEYDSIMNYNHPFDEVSFSTSAPFQDYEHIASQNFGSQYQDDSRLDEMWEQGGVGDETLCG
jgi:hypothetical protein